MNYYWFEVSLMRYYTLLQDSKRNNDIGKTSTNQTDTQTGTKPLSQSCLGASPATSGGRRADGLHTHTDITPQMAARATV